MDEPRIRVLLVAGPFEVRGSSAYTLRLGESLPAYGVDSSVVCSDAHLIEARKRADLRILEYPHLTTPLVGRLELEELRRELAAEPPDLIHVQSRHVLAAGTRLARSLDRPLVVTIQDFFPSRERIRFEPDICRRVIAVSGAVKSELVSRAHYPEERIVVIHSGVKTSGNGDPVPVLDPSRVPVVGTAGPLEAVKGHPFFLGAARQVIDGGDAAEFLLAGAGPEEENLRRLCRELGIGAHVTFVSHLRDFSQALSAMDLFCLPSLRQGLGTIMLEAMALGRPVIATGVGGVYSVIRDNETGLVVPPSNSQRLAERIRELLRDPVRARALGEAGRRLVQREFSVDQMLERTAAVYREVLAEAGRGGGV